MSELTATDEAIEQIIKAGFSHIKVELEADLSRDGERSCDECDDGYINCEHCDGDGVVMAERPNGSEVEVECDECYGEGRSECDECEGRGYAGGYHDEEWCEEFMKEWVPADVRNRLTYGNFYEDGSVDSEFTFTVPATAYKDVVVWINSFIALSEEIGNGYETRGAGMHISVIPDYSRGSYPVDEEMPTANIENFKEQMSKLIPAMMFFSSSNNVSRDLGYRHPQVASNEKYSAIYTHDDTCIEYRAFETCYQEPEAIFEHFEVIAKTLEFYADPNKKANVETFSIDTYGRGPNQREVSRFYSSPEKIKALRKQLKYLRPIGKSNKECFEKRGMFSVTQLRKQQSKRRAELRIEYYKAKAAQAVLLAEPLTERQLQRLERLKQEQRQGYYRELSEQDMIDSVRNITDLGTVEQYINNHLNN